MLGLNLNTLKKTQNTTEKSGLHPRNPHRFNYNFEALGKACPDLQNVVFTNEHKIVTIDFSNPEAVKTLNKAFLIAEYDIQNWDIPANYLCPPIPGRADTFIT